MHYTTKLLLVIPFLSGCAITLPSLTTEQSTYAAYVAEAICISTIVGDGTDLNQTKVNALKEKYGSTDLTAAFKQANSSISSAASVNEVTASLKEDPIQAGLFAKEVVSNIQMSCGLENASAVAQQLKKYLPAAE